LPPSALRSQLRPLSPPSRSIEKDNMTGKQKITVSTKEMVLSSKEDALLQRGLDWIGFRPSRRTNSIKTQVRRFKAMYIEGPVAIHKLFSDCKQTKKKFKEKYALMALMWLGKKVVQFIYYFSLNLF
jgi:hypothetical protein